MLSHLSSKFSLGPEDQTHEPRAALFLNRFTRTLTVMYATSGIEQIIGIPSEQMIGKSFFFIVDENCLNDAIKCIESAKGNDSIAYLRFVFRDPRDDLPSEPATDDSEDDIMTDVTSGDESEDGPPSRHGSSNGPSGSSRHIAVGESASSHANSDSGNPSNRHSADRATSASHSAGSPYSEVRDEPIELEAVISCTSDGLVVCLRRARPLMPAAQLPTTQPPHQAGIFAAPWAPQPMFQPALPQPPPYPLGAQHPAMAQAAPSATQSAFMQSIRDVAVFAWALVGINGSLTDYSRGKPVGESQPPDGFPVWDPSPGVKSSVAHSGYVSGSGSSSSNDPFGDPGLS